ncbi:MAG TPA: TetR/AcrR family transcriptional regulator [Verrucomicrobiae bacterium]|jgi:AcrR family transcriptional regulator|nr:TetR/AcrR family transcriptional regulator [Verrucomicrobiae bacterium]
MKNGPATQKTGGRNPQQTQQRILEAALEEFAAKGFAGARVDVIARRARINKRMLYHYFGDKEGLFREVLRRKIAERRAWLASASEDPTERLPAWFQLACRDREWIQLLQWEALQWGEKKVIDEERRQENIARAIERVRQQQAKGMLDPDLDPGQLLLSMMAITAYPMAFPQLARLATGLSVSDEKFQKQREAFLRQFAGLLRGNKANSAG